MAYSHKKRSNFFVDRPIFSTVMSLLITLLGLIAIVALPIDQYPDLVPPRVTVDVSYPGASAQTIAQTVLAPLEVQLNGVEDMLYIASSASSGAGSGTIEIIFRVGADPDIALVNVNNRVNLAQTALPEEVRRQGVRVTKSSPTMLMVIGLFAPDGRYEEIYLNSYLQTNIVDAIKRLPGVGSCEIFSNMEYAMRVWLLPDKLAKYNLTPNDVAKVIRSQNAQYAPGRMGTMPGPRDIQLSWQIDTRGRLVTAEEFGNIVIRAASNTDILRLKDVAQVTLGSKDYSLNDRLNNLPTRMAGVYLLPGANALETGKLIEAELEKASRRFPEGMQSEIVYNGNIFVEESIREVLKTLAEAIVLVFLVVYIFLQNWRATVISCLAIPVSIIGTFAGIYALGYTINTLTLFGVVLAIGIVVDDAIVVLENVERIMRTEHKSAKDATVKAMDEVTRPLIAIVLVLCAVFIPVSFMGGLVGEMYEQFAITISISVIFSGIVALTLTPTLCALLLKPHDEQKTWRFFMWFNYYFAKITHKYVRGVRNVKNMGKRSMLAFVLMLVAMAWLFKDVPTSLVPQEDQGYFIGVASLADGASLPRTEAVMDVFAKRMLAQPALENLVTLAGVDFLSSGRKSNTGSFFAVLKHWDMRPSDEDSVSQFAHRVPSIMHDMPEARAMALTPSPISGMSTSGGFEGFVQSLGTGTTEELEHWANMLAEAAQKRPEIGVVRNLFSTSSPLLYANLDRDRCLVLGVDIGDVFTAMQGMFGTMYVNDFNYAGRTFQVLLQATGDFRQLPQSLADVFVRSNTGEMIPLNTLVTFESRIAPDTVTRYNVAPAAQIMGSPAPGYTSGQAIQAMEELAAEILPLDYNLGWASAALQEKIAGTDTVLIFVLSILMVFLILAAQYESWSLPLAVLTAVPFGIFGAIVTTWALGLANDVYFQVALVTLVGLAAKNAILIVEFAATAWRQGKNLDVAAMHASRLRFRPIIMTSLAFIVGCIPLAMSTGAGANSRHAIGTAVIGGMLAATCIATIFVPFFFKKIMQFSLWLQGKNSSKQAA